MAWTPDQAREMAKKGGKAAAEKARARAALTSNELAKVVLDGNAELAAKVLVEAMNDVELPTKERAEIAKRILEYAIGRPRISEPTKTESEDDKEPSGPIEFSTRES